MHTPENKILYKSDTKDKKRKSRGILVFWFACGDTFILCDNKEMFKSRMSKTNVHTDLAYLMHLHINCLLP